MEINMSEIRESEDRDSWIVGTIQAILLKAGLEDKALELALDIADAIEAHDAELKDTCLSGCHTQTPRPTRC
jgi:hypothetical protein